MIWTLKQYVFICLIELSFWAVMWNRVLYDQQKYWHTFIFVAYIFSWVLMLFLG